VICDVLSRNTAAVLTQNIRRDARGAPGRAGRPRGWHGECCDPPVEVNVKPTFKMGWLIFSATAGLGCANKTFFRADPPVNAQGFSVALIDQGCDLDQDPETQGSFVQDTMVAVQVTNASPAPVRIETDKTRLAWNKQSAAPDQRPDVVTLKPGEGTRMQLHFTPKGPDVACNNPLTLAWSDAVTVAGKPISVPPLKFQLSATPDP
jgi:hypothetical protein